MPKNQDITTTENADGSLEIHFAGATRERVKANAARSGMTFDEYVRKLIADDKPRRRAVVASWRN